MAGEEDRNAERRRERRRRYAEDPEVRERAREAARRWREKDPEAARESHRRWRQANPEKVQEQRERWRATHLERAREMNRQSEARRRARRVEEEKAERAAARALTVQKEAQKRYRATHRESESERKRKWNEANPERVKETQRRSYERNKEKIAARSKAKRDAAKLGAPATRGVDAELVKARAKRFKENHPTYKRDYMREYRKDPEKYARMLERNRATRQLEKRLAELGLPARVVRRVPIAERRENERAAREFFGARQPVARWRQRAVFGLELRQTLDRLEPQLIREEAAQIAARRRAGLAVPSIEDAVHLRAAAIVQADEPMRWHLLTQEDIAAVVDVVEHDRWVAQVDGLKAAVTSYVEKNTSKLEAEAHLENRARVVAGKQPVRLDVVVHKIAFDEVRSTVPVTLLSTEDAMRTVNEVAARSAIAARLERELSTDGGTEPGRQVGSREATRAKLNEQLSEMTARRKASFPDSPGLGTPGAPDVRPHRPTSPDRGRGAGR